MCIDCDSGMARDFDESIRTMMEAFGQAVRTFPELTGISAEERQLRRTLLAEEYNEYTVAEAESDLVEIADALADMTVIIFGTANACGIDLPAVLGEVMRSNMSKVNPKTGKVDRREDGKILKGDNYLPPMIEDYM